MKTEDNCIFCKIVKGEIPSVKIWEDENFLAFLDIQPINKGHALVIPKEHSKLVSEMEKNTLSNLLITGEKISLALRKSTIKCEAISFIIADGESAGQEVPHVHLHVIPRFKNDGFGFKHPENYEEKPSKEELEEIAKEIRE